MPQNKLGYTLFIIVIIVLGAGCSRKLFLPITANQWQADAQKQVEQIQSPTVSVQQPTLTLASILPIPATPTPTSYKTQLNLPLLKKSATQVIFNWQLTPHSLQGNNENSKVNLQIQYPVVSGESSSILDGLNQQVQDWINHETDNFLQMVQTLPPDTADGFLTATYTVTSNSTWSMEQMNPPNLTAPPVYAGDQAVWDGGRPVVSLLFTISEYTGEVHPFDQHYSINYDLSTGKLITLNDLFKPNEDFLPVIADFASHELHQRQDLPPEQIEPGVAPSADNYKIWNITPQGLLITFEEYQVGPYAAGPQMVLVPFDTLSALISPDGPLRDFAEPGS